MTSALSRIATIASSGTGAGEHAVLPARALQPLAEHLQEAGVGVEDGQADRSLRRGAAPLARLDGVCRCHLKPELRQPASQIDARTAIMR